MARFRKYWRYLVFSVPAVAVLFGAAPHMKMLSGHVAKAHRFWYDALGHLYISWERFETLFGARGFYDFLWFSPYPDTGTYNEPALVHGFLFGVLSFIVPTDPLAFNLTMLTILALNGIALMTFLSDRVHRPWVAAILGIAGALAPMAWIRYAHPTNTLAFFGLFGMVMLARASKNPTWRRCVLAPVLFVLQIMSAFYAGMFFVVPLLVLLPMAITGAYRNRNLRTMLMRMGIATLLCIPVLVVFLSPYYQTRKELGRVYTYEYVSEWQSKGAEELALRSPLTCHLGGFGVEEDEEACRESEMFPGRVLVILTTASVLLALLLWVRRRQKELIWIQWFLAVGPPAVGLVASFIFGLTLPFHIGLWTTAILLPMGIKGTPRRPSRVLPPLILSLLVADIAINPGFELFGVWFTSIHWYFFNLVPGFDGLRSEYRIVILLPVGLAWVAAIGLRRLLAVPLFVKRKWLVPTILAVLGLAVMYETLPPWQSFAPMPSRHNAGPVLTAAANLPEDAVISVVRGRGVSLKLRTHEDGNYFLGHIISHGHRQVNGYSTYKSPASKALYSSIGFRGDRGLHWHTRIAYLFGATHLLVDWREDEAPSKSQLARYLSPKRNLEFIESDEHMALARILPHPDTAHGPVDTEPPLLGPRIAPKSVRASQKLGELKHAFDSDTSTTWDTRNSQRRGDWFSLEFDKPTCVSGISFSPGTKTSKMPVKYSIQAKQGTKGTTLFEQKRWEIPAVLVDHPTTGLHKIAFKDTTTTEIRLMVLAENPWSMSFSEFHAHGCQPDGATNSD